MLEGFIEETCPLNDFEKGLLDGFVSAFIRRVGKEQAITNKEIQETYKANGTTLSDARVRKIINHIRMNNLVPGLIATSRGYYVSKDPAEVLSWIKSLHGRETAISAIRSNVLNYLSILLTKTKTV